MKRKYVVGIAVASLVCVVQGMYEIESLKGGDIDTAFATRTNLVIKFNRAGRQVSTLDTDTPLAENGREIMYPYAIGRSRVLEHGEDLVLTPDKKTILIEGRHGVIIFTPVLFKNQQKGFRIFGVLDGAGFGTGETNDIAYVTLNDTLVRVGKEDVQELIVIASSSESETTASPPIPETSPDREKPVTVTNDETPDNIAEGEPIEGKSKVSNLWFYIVTALCTLLAVLWVVKRKRKRDSP